MSPERIERVRAFADILADYIAQKNDRGFFQAVTFSERPRNLRNALEKAQRNEYLQHQKLLFRFDDYVAVFEAENNAGFADWSLMRDLICIRMIEQLHNAKWLVPDDLKNQTVEETQTKDEGVDG